MKKQFLEQINDLYEREKQFEADCRKCLSDMLKEGQKVDLTSSYYVELTPCKSFDGLAHRMEEVVKRDGVVYVYSQEVHEWFNIENTYGSLTDLIDAVYTECYE